MLKTEDSWDWEWLWFAALHIYRIPEERFWSMYPRQLFVFTKQYKAYHEDTQPKRKGEAPKAQEQGVYIDQIW